MAKVKVTIEDGDKDGTVNWRFRFKPDLPKDPENMSRAQRVGWEMAMALKKSIDESQGEEWESGDL